MLRIVSQCCCIVIGFFSQAIAATDSLFVESPDRKGADWYIGGMTAGEERKLKLPLEFLGEGRFQGEFLIDNPAEGPTALIRREQIVSKTGTIPFTIPRAGGFAARVTKSRG